MSRTVQVNFTRVGMRKKQSSRNMCMCALAPHRNEWAHGNKNEWCKFENGDLEFFEKSELAQMRWNMKAARVTNEHFNAIKKACTY